MSHGCQRFVTYTFASRHAQELASLSLRAGSDVTSMSLPCHFPANAVLELHGTDKLSLKESSMSRLQDRAVTVAMPELLDFKERALPTVVSSLEVACCAILAALLLWKGILPGWRVLNSDFPNYYLVARLLREGYSLDRIYDWIWLQRIKDHWGLDRALVGFAGLSPFSALPVVPFSIFPAIVAKRLWIVVNVLFLFSSVELLSRVTSLGRRRIWLLALLAVFPLRTSFLLGQMHVLVLLLLIAAYYFHRKGRQIACGVCLAIAGALKVYPLLLAGYFLWKKQWRPAFAIFCTTLLLLAVGYLWFGSDVMNIYVAQILPRSLQGEVLDPYNAHAASGSALFHRLFIAEPALNPAPLLNSPSLYAVLYPLFQVAVLVPLLAVCDVRAGRPDAEQLEWASPGACSTYFVAGPVKLSLRGDDLSHRPSVGCPADAGRAERCGRCDCVVLPHLNHRVLACLRV